MITEQKKATSPDKSRVRCHRTDYCRCGQELEGRTRDHCPRCGTTLRSH